MSFKCGREFPMNRYRWNSKILAVQFLNASINLDRIVKIYDQLPYLRIRVERQDVIYPHI